MAKETKEWTENGLALKSKPRRSSPYGYGNRRVIICCHCQEVIADLDPGNGAGFRWAAYLNSRAISDHARNNPTCVSHEN